MDTNHFQKNGQLSNAVLSCNTRREAHDTIQRQTAEFLKGHKIQYCRTGDLSGKIKRFNEDQMPKTKH